MDSSVGISVHCFFAQEREAYWFVSQLSGNTLAGAEGRLILGVNLLMTAFPWLFSRVAELMF